MGKTPLSTSTGTKVLIALTGLALFVFLILHLAGNVLVFAGPDVFNRYSTVLAGNPLVLAIELGLAAVFLLHAFKAARNFAKNRQARPSRYHVKKRAGAPSRKSAASSTMIVTGTITFLFLVIHLKHFRFGEHLTVPGTGERDLYGLELQVFSNPLVVAFYVLAMGVIGFHLWHGIWSACQSLGLGNARYTPKLALFGKVMAVLIAGGFLLIPIFVYFRIFVGGTP